MAAVSLVCFLVIAFAYSRGYFDGLNQAVNAWATSIQTGALTVAANLVSYCFDTTVLLAVTLPMIGFLLYKGYTQKAGLLIGAMGADALVLEICKTVVISTRPLNALVAESDYSFPSGHVTSTIVFIGMLIYFAWQKRETIAKLCLAAAGPALVVIVAFDRLYLNVHWLSDVLAAPFLALFIVAVTILIIQQLTRWYNRRRNKAQSAAPLEGSLDLRDATLYGRAITNTQHSEMAVATDA